MLGGAGVGVALACCLRQSHPAAGADAPPAPASSPVGMDLTPADDADEEASGTGRGRRRSSAEWRRRAAAAENSPKSPPASLAPLEGVFGVDIGGTLAKLVFLGTLPLPPPSWRLPVSALTVARLSCAEKVDADTLSSPRASQRKANFLTAQERFGSTGQRYTALQFPCEQLGGILHFIKFETRCEPEPKLWLAPRSAASGSAARRRLDNALRIVKEGGLLAGMERVYMSGGGAFKYEAKIEEELDVRCVPVDEFEALVRPTLSALTRSHFVLTPCLHLQVWGIDYVLAHGPADEVYTMVQRAAEAVDASSRGARSDAAKPMIDDEIVIHPSECLSQVRAHTVREAAPTWF